MRFKNHEAAVGYLKERLTAWGATRISYHEASKYVDGGTIDFETPFPGEQPIVSGIELHGVKVRKAAVRYGVLDGSLFATHPSRDVDQIDRLKMIATRSNAPDAGSVIVNYGDEHREPRPHLLLGWESVYYGEMTKVTFTDPEREYRIDTAWPVIKQFGESVRREFRGEWAEE